MLLTEVPDGYICYKHPSQRLMVEPLRAPDLPGEITIKRGQENRTGVALLNNFWNKKMFRNNKEILYFKTS